MTETATEPRRRGRPRAPEITLRDDATLQVLQGGPKTRNEVAEALNVKPSFAYLSLTRLRKNNRVNLQRGEGNVHTWSTA